MEETPFIIAGILAVCMFAEGWYYRRKFRNRLKDILGEHLSDPRWQWRTFEALCRAIHADEETTTEPLVEIRARPSESEKDVWTLES